MMSTTNSPALIGGAFIQNLSGDTQMEKTYKLKIIHKCRVGGKHQEPGNIVEVNEEDKRVLVGMKNATDDLKWEAPKKDAKPEAKK